MTLGGSGPPSPPLLPSDDSPLVLPLANSTSGVPFSSRGIIAATGPPPVGQIAHQHHPLTFAANHHYPPAPFYHLQQSPYSPHPPPNINLGHLAPSTYSPNPTPMLPPTYQQQPYQQQIFTAASIAFMSPPANRFHTPLWPRPLHNPSMAPPHLSALFRPYLTITLAQNDSGVPRFHKLDFPMYDGFVDPLGWFRSCEQFFRGQHTAKADKVWTAAYHLTNDAQFWYLQLKYDFGMLTWEQFKEACHVQFGRHSTSILWAS